MEDLPDNIYETKLQLHKTEERDSELCDKFYLVSFIIEDKNNFKIRANSTEGDENFLFHFRFSDYVNQTDKDFCIKSIISIFFLKHLKQLMKRKQLQFISLIMTH